MSVKVGRSRLSLLADDNFSEIFPTSIPFVICSNLGTWLGVRALLEGVRYEEVSVGREGPGPCSRTGGEHMGLGEASLISPFPDASPALS